MLWLLAAAGCRQEKVWRIGVSQCSSDDWRQKMNEEILREGLFHDNVRIEIRSADDCSERQIADIRRFAEEGFDLIIASPNEAAALTPVVREVWERGIPIVLFDRTVNGEAYTAWQGADNAELGRAAARMALRLTDGNCRAIEIRGLDGSTPAAGRHAGFLEPVAGDEPGRIEVLGSAAGDWNDTKGFAAADSLLRVFPEANLIYAHNDRMAVAASRAARQLGRRNLRIIGIDAAPAIGLRAVADSLIDATFLYPTEGHQLVRTALAILEGRPYERRLLLPTAPAVDRSNAEMLLLQDKALREETEKVEWLKRRVDDYLGQHTAQTIALYAVVAVLILFAWLIFMLLRAHWSSVRHRRVLDAKNRELEQQRDELNRLYSQLQEATQSKLSFFTNVSHDLRTPLTLIADPVEQLAGADNIDDRQRTLMRLADKNVKILRRLINQILDFRKYESGSLTLHLAETDLRSTIGEWAESFRHAALKRHIRFTLDLDPAADLTLAVDVEKFERIFFNLLSNAFKYTPVNETVTVRATSDGTWFTLSVADTGRGIGREDLERIFERFYQVEKIRPDGSGIGLTLVKAFAELHGGTVTATSEAGRGSCFTVAIPVLHTGQPVITPPREELAEASVVEELTDVESELLPAESAEGARTVLVIDDNADIRTLVSGLLCDRYTVLQASNGLQGIKLASKYAPDLVICDVMMPGIDGMETCRRLKSEVTTSHIPVLLLTACSMDEQRVEGYACGADAYLSKPFNSKMLLARCEALVLNRKRIADALSSAVPGLPLPAAPAETGMPAAASDIDSDFYRRFTALVDRRMSDSELSVEELASEMGLSRVQFYRKIKSLTNYSPAELLRILRLKRADVLLRTTEQTISEILYSVGFASPSYFTKCYREYFGETPTDVQKRTSRITGR